MNKSANNILNVVASTTAPITDGTKVRVPKMAEIIADHIRNLSLIHI